MTSIANMIEELKRGEEAIAKVPELERQVGYLQRDLDTAQHHSQSLELTLGQLREQIETLQHKLASVEAERDQYGFRNLETDELLAKLRSLIAPPHTPEPVKEPAPKVEPVDPVPPLSSSDPNVSTSTSEPVLYPVHGMSAPNTSDYSPSNPPATMHPEPLAKPYEGQGHWERPHNISWDDWKAGGGEIPYWMK